MGILCGPATRLVDARLPTNALPVVHDLEEGNVSRVQALRWAVRPLWWRKGKLDPRNKRSWFWSWREDLGTYERKSLPQRVIQANREGFRFLPRERLVKWIPELGKYEWCSQGLQRYKKGKSRKVEVEDNVAFLDCWGRSEQSKKATLSSTSTSRDFPFL